MCGRWVKHRKCNVSLLHTVLGKSDDKFLLLATCRLTKYFGGRIFWQTLEGNTFQCILGALLANFRGEHYWWLRQKTVYFHHLFVSVQKMQKMCCLKKRNSVLLPPRAGFAPNNFLRLFSSLFSGGTSGCERNNHKPGFLRHVTGKEKCYIQMSHNER